MSERFVPKIIPKSAQEKPYTTLRGLVIKSSVLIGLGGAIVGGYGINKVRLEEDAGNQVKADIVRQFNKTNPNPNSTQLLELEYDLNDANNFSKTAIISTATGSPIMALGLNASILAYLFMAEESPPSDRKKRDNQKLTGILKSKQGN